MTTTNFAPSQTMPYTHRLASYKDTEAIASLMAAFTQERSAIDPTREIKPDFDFKQYIADHITKPLHYYWVLEYNTPEQKAIAGFLHIFVQDEAPPPTMPADLAAQHNRNRPYKPRRTATALALYILPQHRQFDAIKQLIDTGIHQAKDLKVSDIDLQVAAEQTRMHALLERMGFAKISVQYTYHFDISDATELPSLHLPHPEFVLIKDTPTPETMPLRDPKTKELVRNPNGNIIFLKAVENYTGTLPIFPLPVRHPQTQDWVFDSNGELVVSPPLRDEQGEIVECRGMVQYCPPAYEIVNGKLELVRDREGKYVICDAERDWAGKIMRSPDGMPVFKQR